MIFSVTLFKRFGDSILKISVPAAVHPSRGQERRNHRHRSHRQEDGPEDLRTLQEGQFWISVS